ncbi:A/G-specific DNA-adenine glycosylase [Pisciglobus halotolerans]|uniref:Adenine DNA glycosylase n=2 Tax=Pisciglobus halotolerans TaxID=745365 RepID=A0A1I3AUY7_9LACT|nr:A/G-specific DNA-adenine glycosylase [Pisciglobus halotolerans]
MTNKDKKMEVLELFGVEMWPQEKIEAFRAALLSWYDIEKRDLPWRENHDPYRIWVSEIMLQQTRVETVIPYFLRFMELFPTIADLAAADEDMLLKAWEGLGYYSRVRNLQKAAIQIMEDYGGEMPKDPAEIRTLKGIGPYTAGAIASMAFQLPEPAVDGNIMRILSRLFEIDADIAKPGNRKVFEAVLREIIDPYRPGDFNQALMDLGSSICTPKNYHPENSPVKAFNQSYINETWEKYPVKSKKKKAQPVFYAGVLLRNEKGEFLLEKRPEKGLLANMWTFPLIERPDFEQQLFSNGKLKGTVPAAITDNIVSELDKKLTANYHISLVLMKRPLAEATHIFTHLKWTIAVYFGRVEKENSSELPASCKWVAPEDFQHYVFPGPQIKMWEAYQKKFKHKSSSF